MFQLIYDPSLILSCMASKEHMYDDVRKVFRDVSAKHLDWPEAIWDAWVSFEQLHGTVEELENALAHVERAQTQVNARRAKVSMIRVQVLVTCADLKLCRRQRRRNWRQHNSSPRRKPPLFPQRKRPSP